MKSDINFKNKKAYFNYEFIDKYIAGIQLKGTEIKSIRLGKVSFNDSYCYIDNDELWLKNMQISIYEKGSYNNHEPLRMRKLLLKKKEINKLRTKSVEKGLTIVPLRMFINEKGFAKLEIALAKGKKEYDKRESIKKRDIERELGRKFK